MFLGRCKHQARQTKIAHASASLFKAFRISYFALRALGLSCLLRVARAFVTAAFFVLQATSFIICPFARVPHTFVSWANTYSIHFSRFQFTGCLLFSSPAGSLGLRAFLVFCCNRSRQQKMPSCWLSCGIN